MFGEARIENGMAIGLRGSVFESGGYRGEEIGCVV